jgi:hypothetical protein
LFAAALAAIQRAQKLDPEDADSLQVEAAIHRWQAQSLIAQRQSPSRELAAGLQAAARALAINPKLAPALAERGELLWLRAQKAPRKDSDEKDARAALAQALAVNPLLQRDYPPR